MWIGYRNELKSSSFERNPSKRQLIYNQITPTDAAPQFL